MNKVSVDVIMDNAKNEIMSNVMKIMSNNAMPTGLMVYVLESICNDLSRSKSVEQSKQVITLNNEIQKKEKKGDKDGDSNAQG